VHGDTFVHDLLLLDFDSVEVLQGLLESLNDRVRGQISTGGRLGNKSGKIRTGLAKKVEARLVGIELFGDLNIGGLCHLHLVLVVEETLLVLAVDGSRGHSRPGCTVLSSQLSVFLLLFLKSSFHVFDQVVVDLDNGSRSLDSLSKVLGRALLLEFFDLGPDSVGDFGAGSD